MVQDAEFSPKVVIWLITVGLLSFAGAIYFVIYGDEGIARTSGANSFSYSAIGHRAFVETLRRTDVPVLVSRDDSAAKAGRSALLVVAEPRWRAPTDDTVDDLLSADTLLIVLPKWQGRPDEANPRWLEFAVPLPRAEVEETLRRAVPGARVRRIAGSVSWQPGRFGVSPTLSVPQLIETAALTPIVASDRGLLLGELVHGGQRIWILSDPDILSNHGLGRGDNSVLTSRLIDALRPPGGAVIIDETIHGFRRASGLWHTLFEFPFVVSTILALAAIIVLSWAATGRFGAPIPAQRSLPPGKTALIDNTANLLRYGGHGPEILRRYQSVTLRDVARRLHAPRNLDEDALVDWVDRVGEARGVRAKYRNLRHEAEARAGAANADNPRLALAAQNLYRWKQEIINGPGGSRRDQPTTQAASQEDDRRARRGP